MNFRWFIIVFGLMIWPCGGLLAKAVPGVVKSVEINGITHPDVVSLVESYEFNTHPGTRISNEAILKDVTGIYALGVFQAVSYQTVPSSNGFVVQFWVTENAVIQDIRFEGTTKFSRKRLLKKLDSQPGQVINYGTVGADRRALTEYYKKKGYQFFMVDEILNQEGILKFNVDEGRVATINVVGIKKIDPQIVWRAMELRQGDIFDRKKLSGDRNRLLRLGYFSEVTVTELTRGDDDKITIGYRFREKKSNFINLGLEQEQNLSRSGDQLVAFLRTNLNHKIIPSDLISLKTQVGQEGNGLDVKSYSIQYVQPWIANKYPLSVAVDGWTEFRRQPLSRQRLDNKRRGASLRFGLPRLSDRLVLSSRLKFEDVSPLSSGDFDPYDIRSLSGAVSFSTIRQWQNPENGMYWTVEYEQSGDLGLIDLGGVDLKRLNVNTAVFLSPFPRQVLGLHAFTGFTKQGSPTFEGENYELGGSNSLRGYQESQFFGAKKLVFNAEYRVMVSSKFQIVGFWDTGQVFQTQEKIDFGEFLTGTGFGVRWFTPIGPFRLDFGKGETDWIIHFNLGQVF